jgi:hypothetical protein
VDVAKDFARAKRHLQEAYKQVIQDCQANLERLESAPKGDKRPWDLIPLEGKIGNVIVCQAKYQILAEVSTTKN